MDKQLCLSARLGEHILAIPIEGVGTIEMKPEIVPIHRSLEYVRGTIEVQGEWLAVIDLRVWFRLRSVAEERQELRRTLESLEREHDVWFARLPQESDLNSQPCCVKTWQAKFVPPNPRFRQLMNQLDVADDALHAAASEIIRHRRDQDPQGADRVKGRAHTRELARFHLLFDRAIGMVSRLNEPIAVSLTASGHRFAVLVDQVHRVEPMLSIQGCLGQRVACLDRDRHAMVLDAASLPESLHPPAKVEESPQP